MGSEVDQDVPLYGEDDGVRLQEEEGEKITGDQKQNQHVDHHFSTESLFTETVEQTVNKGAVKEIRGEDIRGRAYVILIIVTCQL